MKKKAKTYDDDIWRLEWRRTLMSHKIDSLITTYLLENVENK